MQNQGTGSNQIGVVTFNVPQLLTQASFLQKIQILGCSTAASQQQMALNFELVVSDQLFSVIQNKRPWMRHM